MELIVVGMAGCGIGDTPDQVLATYALGSCIGLSVYDRRAGVGGLLHFMLPDSTIDAAKAANAPFMFADTGIPRLLQGVFEKGGSKRRLIVLAAGAANMLDTRGGLEIGKRNYLALRRILWKLGLLVHGEAIGGAQSRSMRLEIGTGKVWLQVGGERQELIPAASQRGDYSWHIAS